MVLFLLLYSLPLEIHGEALSYFYSLSPSVQSRFKEISPSFLIFPNKESGVMIYTKKYK